MLLARQKIPVNRMSNTEVQAVFSAFRIACNQYAGGVHGPVQCPRPGLGLAGFSERSAQPDSYGYQIADRLRIGRILVDVLIRDGVRLLDQ